MIEIDKETEKLIVEEAVLRGVSKQMLASACFESGFRDVVAGGRGEKSELQDNEEDDSASPALVKKLDKIFAKMRKGKFYTSAQMRERYGIV